MRTNEKLFWTLLQHGCDRHLEGDNERKNKCIAKAQLCMQTEPLGDEKSKRVSQWQLPFVGGKIQPKTVTNVTSGKCIVALKALVDTVYSEELDEQSLNPQHCQQQNAREKDQRHELLDVCIDVMTLLCRKEDFWDAQIDVAHMLTASFVSKWVAPMKGQSVTNHIHIIGSGHLHCHLQKF